MPVRTRRGRDCCRPARDLFLLRGYEATPVRTIADQAGVTIGAFYGRFRSQRTVLLNVVRAMIEPRKGRRSLFSTPAHRALVLTVASLAHEDFEAATGVAAVLQVPAPGVEKALDLSKAGKLLVDLARRSRVLVKTGEPGMTMNGPRRSPQTSPGAITAGSPQSVLFEHIVARCAR